MNLFAKHKNSSHKSDLELLAIFAKTKNPEVLGQLYLRYIHLVYGTCLKYLKNSDNAKDAVSEIYAKLQSGIHNYKIKNFKSWLFVLTKNYCLMELRKTKPGKHISLDEAHENKIFMEIDSSVHPVDEENFKSDKALLDCIEKLNDFQKKSIKLFYFENKCYREIAHLEHCEEKKIKSRIQNGKRNLKLCLEKQK